MRMLTIMGAVLVGAGLIALILPFIPFTSEQQILDFGPVEATAEQERTIDIPLFVGLGLLAVGAIMLIIDRIKQ